MEVISERFRLGIVAVIRNSLGQEHFWFLAEFQDGAEPDLSRSDGCFRSWRWGEPAALIAQLFLEKREAFQDGLRVLGLLTNASPAK